MHINARASNKVVVNSVGALLISAISVLPATSWSSAYQNEVNSSFYSRIYTGYSMLDDQTIHQEGIAEAGATARNKNGSGYLLGGALGYRFDDAIALELAWNYTTNDTENYFSDGNQFTAGDFFSSILFVNGIYTFGDLWNENLNPYLGLGLGYVEEIDIDLERKGIENSYSKKGALAYQAVTGLSYNFNRFIDIFTELNYVYLSNFDLSSKSGSGRLINMNYNPISLNIGISYHF